MQIRTFRDWAYPLACLTMSCLCWFHSNEIVKLKREVAEIRAVQFEIIAVMRAISARDIQRRAILIEDQILGAR